MGISIRTEAGLAIVTIDNPPVNALSQRVRAALVQAVADLDADDEVRAVVLAGAGRLFVGGADIAEFDFPPQEPHLPDLLHGIETARKPWIAALRGAALGGGLEIALACAFRVATPDTRLALPEVNLGIIPGAGGTQRLPRLIGVEAAVGIVAENRALDGRQAVELGLVDRLAEGDLIEEACALAREWADRPRPTAAIARNVTADAELWSAAETRIARAAKGNPAPLEALRAMRLGVDEGAAAGLAHERAAFLRLRAADEAAALRYLFFAERGAHRPAALKGIQPLDLQQVGVVGGGTMGSGIAAALLAAGLRVTLSERDDTALQRGLETVRGLVEAGAKRGHLPDAAVRDRLDRLEGCVGLAAMAGCDLIIEAVFEKLEVKRAVFAELGRLCGPRTIFATNTSYLDPRVIAEGLPGPERFLGLHFFSPADVMKLLEIIPTDRTAPEVLATAFDLARRLAKIPVRAGICDGFIGNRILRRYRAAAEALVREGVPIADVDAAMRAFGCAMGPFEMQDMAGLDISWMLRQAARERGETVPEEAGDLLVAAGRKGQKTQAGWYDYQPGDRTPQPSAEAARIIAPLVSGELTLSGTAIADHLVRAMAEEGRAILDEGIATRPEDIDLVEVHGYGFPRIKGGPMFLASRDASRE
ncbi:3-hydroxyacyl-CoA dehydrogenase NAD-binding domain-containing protein [Paracoccus yeei]|uniref:3-hydroxyacyl-CoA dehydrogenase NAD-binding domain-containing protein n=1 Tax=Paracoccus yeei TaxID=147645 RepID=UPI0028D5F9A7|nr:3-hydroxyacyl-CoA dehydrogenase NAD-binding domain-containing protein [Paracoccus yeei]